MPRKEKPSSPLPEAMRWVSEITTIAFEMALPPILGNYGDKWFHTSPWLVLGGALLGLGIGMSHLIRIIRRADE